MIDLDKLDKKLKLVLTKDNKRSLRKWNNLQRNNKIQNLMKRFNNKVGSGIKTIRQQIADRCIHFTGIQNQVCKAGIKYVDIRDESQKPYLFPCNRNLTNSGSHCDKCQFPTFEQVEKELKEIYNG